MPRMALKEEWHLLTARYSADQSLRELLWQEIEGAYTAEGRHYHTLTHLSDLLSLAITHRALVDDTDSLKFAIYYHDLVYNPLRKDNEEVSASQAVAKLKYLGVDQQHLEFIQQMILATKHHRSTGNPDIDLFLDLDLSILGREWEKYHAYTQQIRKEYSLVPCFLYNRGRKKVLKQFLAQPAIYKTAPFLEQYEAPARQNIERELLLLCS